ncbi:MAG: hypothetical protein ACJAS1_007188 [Oleiphilaceae bacterium]|jgi:hypothetical protein
MALTKKQRVELKLKFGGKCAYCGCELPEKGWHADHVKPVLRLSEIDEVGRSKGIFKLKNTGEVAHRDREHFDNYYPSCAPCNLFKATWSIEGFRNQVSAQVSRAREYSVNFRTAERFGLIEPVSKPVIFWFETYLNDSEVV